MAELAEVVVQQPDLGLGEGEKTRRRRRSMVLQNEDLVFEANGMWPWFPFCHRTRVARIKKSIPSDIIYV